MFMQLESSLHEEDLLLCNRGKQRAGRGLVVGHGSKNSALGAHSGSFWHHLGCTLFGPEAFLEHSQGQALI